MFGDTPTVDFETFRVRDEARAWSGRRLRAAALACLAVFATVSATAFAPKPCLAAATVRSRELLSPAYTVDRKYRSMEGPQSTEAFTLGETDAPELLWIVGYRAVMVDGDGGGRMSQEFMCHSNLDIDMAKHRELFGWHKYPSRRLFTLSQGQFEVEFPDGFGIPILSNEDLELTTQVLNHNREGETFHVRHRVTIDYVRDSELESPMKPLFMKAANGLALVEGDDGYYNVEHASEGEHGPGCMVGERAAGGIREDKFGRKFTGHWVVKPGRQVNHTLVTEWMNLPFDTTVHYIAVHLHPFAESLELRDLTSGESVFKSDVRAASEGIGIDHVDYYSSAEGIRLYEDHQYELVSVYDNTTAENQDSMAVMYLYLFDHEFRKPDLVAEPRDDG